MFGLGSLLSGMSPAFSAGAMGGSPLQQLLGAQQPVSVAGQQPLASLPGPSLGQTAAAMPTMAQGPSPFQMLGAALQQKKPDQGIVQAPIAQAPALAPQHNGLGQILAQILGSL